MAEKFPLGGERLVSPAVEEHERRLAEKDVFGGAIENVRYSLDHAIGMATGGVSERDLAEVPSELLEELQGKLEKFTGMVEGARKVVQASHPEHPKR